MTVDWHLQVAPGLLAPQDAMAGEENLLTAIARGQAPATAWIWRSQRCLVVPASQARHARFDDAKAALTAAGWPVVMRRSGGSPVPLDPGTLNLSLAFPAPDTHPWQLDDGFRLLTGILIAALGELGLHATCGMVPDAFCAGRYDLAIDGRKIAGTAQHWRGGRDAAGRRQQAILAHVTLLVAPDLAGGSDIIDQWTHNLHEASRHNRHRVAALCDFLDRALDPPGTLIATVIAAITRQLTAQVVQPRPIRHSWATV